METWATSNFFKYSCQRKARCCSFSDIYFSESAIKNIEEHCSELSEGQIALEGAFIKRREPLPYRHARIKLVDGICPFLNRNEGQCRVFKKFGKEQGNPICLTYPFFKIKLNGRYGISAFLSCESEIDRLFHKENNIDMRVVHDETHHVLKFCFADYSMLPGVFLREGQLISWEDYYSFEHSIIKWCGEMELEPLLARISKALNLMMEAKFSLEDILLKVETAPFEGIKRIQTDWKLFKHFIERKVNLYQNPYYETWLSPCLDLIDNFSVKGGEITKEENDVWRKWKEPFTRYIAIRFFSNTHTFNGSLSLTLHMLVFLIFLNKLMLIKDLRNGEKIEYAHLHSNMRKIERYFGQDGQLFAFWGRGKRGKDDFNLGTLSSLFF